MLTRCFAAAGCAVLLLTAPAARAADDDAPPAVTVSPVTPKPAAADSAEGYRLRYRFTPGEVVRWKVVHLAATETEIRGVTQTSKSRSVSIKAWRVTGQDEQGQATLSHSVEEIDMWQSISGRPEVSYNSRTDAEPPPEYVLAAETVGKPLATVTVSSTGAVQQRDEAPKFAALGMGDLLPPLPEQPVRPGDEWSSPGEVRVRLPNGEVRKIQTRELYTLVSVTAGVATIHVETQPLTPVDEPAVQAQLMQQLKKGELKFDVEAGRLIRKQLDWDEKVLSFNGADSRMHYLARFTEELLPPGEEESQVAAPVAGPLPAGPVPR